MERGEQGGREEVDVIVQLLRLQSTYPVWHKTLDLLYTSQKKKVEIIWLYKTLEMRLNLRSERNVTKKIKN